MGLRQISAAVARRKFFVLNTFLLGHVADMRYGQFGCVAAAAASGQVGI
jgi:hypothetical protein